MKAFAHEWVSFWNARERPTSLVVCRVLIGLSLVGDLLQALANGLVPDAWAPAPAGVGGGRAAVELAFDIWLSPGQIWWVALVSGVLLTLGAALPLSAVASAFASASLAAFSPSGDRGIDALLRAVVLILAFSGASARCSVDAWVLRRLGRPFPVSVPAWPRRLLFVQLLWVYFSAAQNRGDISWWPWGGLSAVGTLLGDPHFARFEPGLFAVGYPLTQALTLGTMVFELSAPLMVLWTYYDATPYQAGRLRFLSNRLRLRWVWIGIGVSFHLGIALTLRLGMFPFGMLALYPALFFPSELDRLGRGLAAAWPARRSPIGQDA